MRAGLVALADRLIAEREHQLDARRRARIPGRLGQFGQLPMPLRPMAGSDGPFGTEICG
jgi:hypothetical protein